MTFLRRAFPLLPAVWIAVGVLAAQPVSAQQYTTIDVPGSINTVASGINSQGDIVGTFGDSAGHGHGYLLHDGAFTTIDFPGSFSTEANGINSQGDIVGRYFDSSFNTHGFLLRKGAFTTVDIPGFPFFFVNAVSGINDQGEMVIDGGLLRGGVFTTIMLPDSIQTAPGVTRIAQGKGINAQGDIVGSYSVFLNTNGLELSRSAFDSIIPPPGFALDATLISADGINASGDIVGWVLDGVGQHGRGFLQSGGMFRALDVPGASETIGIPAGTLAHGINNRRDIVGEYSDGLGHHHGFVSR
jgi:uncharacterized membrane protein